MNKRNSISLFIAATSAIAITTAGRLAAKVKNNLQLKRNSDLSKKFSGLITKKILSSELIKSFALPKKVHGTMFSKSTIGMKYGRHIDNA